MNLKQARGQRIAEARTKAGLTQGELAKKAGLTDDIIWNLEKGKRDLRADESMAICRALHKRLEYIVDGESWPDTTSEESRPREGRWDGQIKDRKTAPPRSGPRWPFSVRTWWRSERLRLLTWIACYCLVAGVFIAFPAWPLRWHALAVAVCCFFVLQLSLRLHSLKQA